MAEALAHELFKYPTATLKNVAKEYNLHYYIKDIERLSKNELITAILTHMLWEEEQEELKNKVEFKTSLKTAKKSYAKEGEKPVRKNYKQLATKVPTPPTPPAEPEYKGKKKTLAAAAANLPTLVINEIVNSPVPTQRDLLEDYRKLTSEQRNELRRILMVDAIDLPKDIEAPLEHMPKSHENMSPAVHKKAMEDLREKVSARKILEAIKAYRAYLKVKVHPANITITEYAKLEAYKKQQPSKYEGTNNDRKRLIDLVTMVINNPTWSQEKMSTEMKKLGYTSGVTQPNISKLLSQAKEKGLFEKTQRKGGLIVKPMEFEYPSLDVYWGATADQGEPHPIPPKKGAKITPALFSQALKDADFLGHALENVNPAEALGYRLIYHELFEVRNSILPRKPFKDMAKDEAKGVDLTKAFYSDGGPVSMRPASMVDKYLNAAGPSDKSYSPQSDREVQRKHGEHMYRLIMKVIEGLSAARRGQNKNVPVVEDLHEKAEKVRKISPKPTDAEKWQDLQHFPTQFAEFD
jgi:hypothetical protein